MRTHGTATEGQLAEFLGAGVKALTLIASSLGPKRLEHWSRNGAELEKRFIQALALSGSEEPLLVPADDEWFDLEVDNDQDPMDVVRPANFNPTGWRYLGPKLTGKRTIKVKLVRLGYCKNLEEAKQKADARGYRLLEGQARESFKKRFPKPDDNDHVVFGGSLCQSPGGGAGVACLDRVGGGWGSGFVWTGGGWDDDWCWAVVRK